MGFSVRRTQGLRRMGLRTGLLGLVAALLLACAVPPVSGPAAPTEILWDTWGVPHIFARDVESAFRAFGWAQMHSHGDLILRLYAQARGRGAEFYGEPYWTADQATRLLGIPERGATWYAAQPRTFRRYVDAFVAGMNEYARQYPDRLAAGSAVLPITGADVFGHIARVMALLVAANSECGAAIPGLNPEIRPRSAGWAIAPERAAGGNALLVSAPSLPWGDFSTLYEVQITAPGVDGYGATFAGFPVLAFGFNQDLAWTHTLSPADVCDLYVLMPAGPSLEQGYLLDGEVHAFETVTQTLKVKLPDGRVRAEPFVVRRAVQGPVLVRNGEALAVRMAGQDHLPVAGLAEQWWAMGQAHRWEEFEAALARRQLPLFHVIYADRDGHIAFLEATNLPRRAKEDAAFWRLPVPGDRAELIWTDPHPARDLPAVLDPPSGWLQTTGGTPWTMTLPSLDPTGNPAYLAPRAMPDSGQFLREQKIVKALAVQDPASLTQVVDIAASTRSELADRVLDDLIAAARQSGRATANEAADVLAAWDRQAEAESRGMALFALWHRAWVRQSLTKLTAANPTAELTPAFLGSALLYATPWNPLDPLDTPRGLFSPLTAVQALETAAQQLADLGYPLDVSWGELARFRRDEMDIAASGGSGDLGIVWSMDFVSGDDGRLVAAGGVAFLAAVEFAEPVQAVVLMPYGNASAPASAHVGDQLVLSAAKEFRPALLIRSTIEEHLEMRTVLAP